MDREIWFDEDQYLGSELMNHPYLTFDEIGGVISIQQHKLLCAITNLINFFHLRLITFTVMIAIELAACQKLAAASSFSAIFSWSRYGLF